MALRRLRFGGLLAGMMAALTAAAQATVIVPGSLTDLVRDAQVIVRGKVLEVRPQWADGRRRVERVVTVEADTYLKGDFGRVVVFKSPGGELGRYRSVVVGAPSFREGEEVVLFLDAVGPALPHIVGFSQGVLRIVREADTGRAVVAAALLDSPGSSPVTIERGDPARQPEAFDHFAARVRVLVTAGGVPGQLERRAPGRSLRSRDQGRRQ
jgi:hypothetical protein